MTRIAIAGAAGRMGRSLVLACQEADDLELTQAIDHAESSALGSDSGILAGIPANGVTVKSELNPDAFDLLVDFTHPIATTKHVDYCCEYGKKIVIGTTGADKVLQEKIRTAGDTIAILYAHNMSVGVNLCLKLLRSAAAVLGDDVDIEIIEAHHRHKVDAPSGTALTMGKVIAETLGRDLNECAVYGREGQTGDRDPKTIGFETIRAGDIVGEHTVMFASEGERIEITHRCSNRMNFAYGAVRASRWLADRDRGYFTMQDALGLS